MTWQIALSRIRLPLILLGVAVLLFGGALGIPWATRAIVFVATYVVALRVGTVRREPVTVQVPVSGQWVALNSPGTKVPSHGVQAYGQTYAIDLVADPEGTGWKGLGWWPLARRPETFPGYGQPILAAADGVVVRAHGRQRDHWSRNSWPAMVYVMAEGLVRELTGLSRILGNHLVIDHGDGVYAIYAHLQKGSLKVEKGQSVRVGEHIANCGNSGNSVEPHLHFQLMDHPRGSIAAGLPVRFERYEVNGGPSSGMPTEYQTFSAPAVEAADEVEAVDEEVRP